MEKIVIILGAIFQLLFFTAGFMAIAGLCSFFTYGVSFMMIGIIGFMFIPTVIMIGIAAIDELRLV